MLDPIANSSAIKTATDMMKHACSEIPRPNNPGADYMYQAGPIEPLKLPTQEDINEYQRAAVFMHSLADEALR